MNLDVERMPPLVPRTVGGKVAVSCHRPGVFLIRAWAPMHGGSGRLVDWICHHIGRLDLDDCEWWGCTYPGQPSYMGRGDADWESGLTIQRFIEPADQWTRKLLDEGRIGPVYGPPEDLPIPDNGVVQRRHGKLTNGLVVSCPAT